MNCWICGAGNTEIVNVSNKTWRSPLSSVIGGNKHTGNYRRQTVASVFSTVWRRWLRVNFHLPLAFTEIDIARTIVV